VQCRRSRFFVGYFSTDCNLYVVSASQIAVVGKNLALTMEGKDPSKQVKILVTAGESFDS